MKHIPFLDINSDQRELLPALQAAAQRVIQSGAYIGGSEVNSLEAELADYLQVAQVVTVNSGTDALFLTMKALDIGTGCEVIVPTYTFVASVSSIVTAGAHPVFVDCAPGSFLLNTEAIESLITPRTKAILAVHLFGQAADMATLMHIAKRHSLHVIEDVAQAFGALYQGSALGSLGVAGAFSFYPTKNLSALGDAGAIATNDLALAQRLRRLRNHGRITQAQYQEPGHNSRLDELQAAFLRVKLPHVRKCNQQRRRIAARYRELLSDLPIQLPTAAIEEESHVYNLFVVALSRRDELCAHLNQLSIGAVIYYREPCHQMLMFSMFNQEGTFFPNAQEWAASAMALPIYPTLSDSSVDDICQTIREWLVHT